MWLANYHCLIYVVHIIIPFLLKDQCTLITRQMFTTSRGWAWALVDHSIWYDLLLNVTFVGKVVTVPPYWSTYNESKNKGSSCNFPYSSPSYSELIVLHKIMEIYSSSFFSNLASLSMMFLHPFIPVLFCMLQICQRTVIHSIITRDGSWVWKGGGVHFVEKVEDQTKGEAGWVKEVAISFLNFLALVPDDIIYH